MAAITWKNINAPSFTASNALAQAAGKQIRDSVAGFGDTLNNYDTTLEEDATKRKAALLAGLTNVDTYMDDAGRIINDGGRGNSAELMALRNSGLLARNQADKSAYTRSRRDTLADQNDRLAEGNITGVGLQNDTTSVNLETLSDRNNAGLESTRANTRNTIAGAIDRETRNEYLPDELDNKLQLQNNEVTTSDAEVRYAKQNAYIKNAIKQTDLFTDTFNAVNLPKDYSRKVKRENNSLKIQDNLVTESNNAATDTAAVRDFDSKTLPLIVNLYNKVDPETGERAVTEQGVQEYFAALPVSQEVKNSMMTNFRSATAATRLQALAAEDVKRKQGISDTKVVTDAKYAQEKLIEGIKARNKKKGSLGGGTSGGRNKKSGATVNLGGTGFNSANSTYNQNRNADDPTDPNLGSLLAFEAKLRYNPRVKIPGTNKYFTVEEGAWEAAVAEISKNDAGKTLADITRDPIYLQDKLLNATYRIQSGKPLPKEKTGGTAEQQKSGVASAAEALKLSDKEKKAKRAQDELDMEAQQKLIREVLGNTNIVPGGNNPLILPGT